MRQVYLAATGMNRGKTTFALGLLAALLARGLSTAFTKPVGQRYALVDDIPADEDAILMRAIFGLGDPLELMSPVHIPRGFTKAFIRGDVVEDLGARIDTAYRRLVEGREAVLIEGTGHAGVGAVVGGFLLFLWRGIRAAGLAPDAFSRYLAAGLTLEIVLQAFINISVVLGLLPTKGIPLPFISAGGSSLVITLVSVGLVLNVSQHAD